MSKSHPSGAALRYEGWHENKGILDSSKGKKKSPIFQGPNKVPESVRKA